MIPTSPSSTRGSAAKETQPQRQRSYEGSWISYLLQQRQRVEGDRKSSSISVQPTTAKVFSYSLDSAVILVVDNAKRPTSPISEVSMHDVPTLIPYRNTVNLRTRKSDYERKVSIEKKRRKTIPPVTTKSSLVVDRWETHPGSPGGTNGMALSMCCRTMPSIPVRLTIASAVKDTVAAVSNVNTTTTMLTSSLLSPSKQRKSLSVSSAAIFASPSNDMAPRKPLRTAQLMLAASLPSLDHSSCHSEDNGDAILDSDFDNDDCTSRKATTIELLDEALNLIAITNQVIDDVTTAAATKTKHSSVEGD
jgi:hypothetical protein